MLGGFQNPKFDSLVRESLSLPAGSNQNERVTCFSQKNDE